MIRLRTQISRRDTENDCLFPESTKSSGSKSISLTFTDEEWNEISPQLSAIMQQPELTLPPTVPFDAASDQPIDEQRSAH
ncbi:hypothetical protein WDU94_012399 [Cyamophila willieti]